MRCVTWSRMQVRKKISPNTSSKSARSLMRCPITNNLPTRMSRESFRRLCALHQSGDDGYCVDVCCGKLPPKGLELIDIVLMSKEITMAAPIKPKPGPCAICDEIKTRRLVKGLEVCSTCSAMVYIAHGHPERLVRSLTMAGNQCALADEAPEANIAIQDKLTMMDDERRRLDEQLSLTMNRLEEYMDKYDKSLNTIERHECRADELQSKIDGLELEIQKLGYDHEIDAETIAELKKEIENKQSVFLEGTLSSQDSSDRASALLDLALDALDGVVQGVNANRIRALR